MAARGYVYKRCPCGFTGTPAKGARGTDSHRPAIPACRKDHGTWWWRAEGVKDPKTGRRRQPSKGGYPTKDAAQVGLNEYLAEVGMGRGVDDGSLTVEMWLRRWLADREAVGREPRTLRGYRSHIDLYLVPHLGRIRLRDLTAGHVDDMLIEMSRPRQRPAEGRITGSAGGSFVERRSARTLDSVRRTLRAALTPAVKRRLIAYNPASHAGDDFKRADDPEAAWWQPGQLNSFLRFVADDPLASLWTVAAFTGMRRSELLGLRWVDVEVDADVPGLRINQRVVDAPGPQPCVVCKGEHRGRRIMPKAKSKAGRRWVPLAPSARMSLLVHRMNQRQEETAAAHPEAYANHGLVWCQDDGSPHRPDEITKRHAELVKAAGLPKIKLHEMRHSAISIMQSAGMTLDSIALIAGHASRHVTSRIYAHAIEGELLAGVEAAEAKVLGSGRRMPEIGPSD